MSAANCPRGSEISSVLSDLVRSGKITQSEALDLFEVSRSTLRKARRAGEIGAEQEPDGRKAWLYEIEDLDVLYRRREPDPVTDPVAIPDSSEPDPVADPVAPDPDDIETRLRLEYVQRDLDQRTAERDRARSDHEQEKAERERLEREAIQLRAELDAARTIATDRAGRIEKLEEQTAKQAEKLDEYGQNLTRRYRRAVRRAGKPVQGAAETDE